MVELGNQRAQVFLGPLTLCYVNVDAGYPLWATIAGIRYETARLDPADLAASTRNPILNAVFAQPLPKRLLPHALHSSKILRERPGLPFAARRLQCSFGQTVQSSVVRVDLHHVRVDIIGVAADEGRLPCQRKLQAAFRQRQLR